MEFPIDVFLKDLEKIINIDSGTHNIAGNFKVAEFFSEKFKEAGFDTEIKKVGGYMRPVVVAKSHSQSLNTDIIKPDFSHTIPLIPDTSGENFDFLLCGHMDTVFPDGTAAQRPFRMDGGNVYGPGTVDMKAGALLILYLARYLKETHKNMGICVVLNSDEEIGSPDSVELLREVASNCNAIFVFEGGRKEGRFVNQRKGIAKYQINIDGIASHSGTAPHKGVSAIVELSKWIVAIDALKDYDMGTSINVGLMEGGTALNVVAPTAKATMEVRYKTSSELARVEKALHLMEAKPFLHGSNAKVTRLSHYPPLTVTKNTESLMKKLAPLGLEYVSAGGTSDANRLACLNIPIIDGCGPGGGFPHSEKEFLRIDTVSERFELMCKVFETLKEDSLSDHPNA